MTVNQFLEADEMEQIEAIWKGILIASRKDQEWLYDFDKSVCRCAFYYGRCALLLDKSPAF